MDEEPVPPAQVLARFAEGWPAVIDCGPGWWPLLERLDAELAEHDPDYTIHQVKQKFGSLRFYAHTTLEFDEQFRSAITRAELWSDFIDEQTGGLGAPMTHNGFMFTGDPVNAPVGATLRLPRLTGVVEQAEEDSVSEFGIYALLGHVEGLWVLALKWSQIAGRLFDALQAEQNTLQMQAEEHAEVYGELRAEWDLLRNVEVAGLALFESGGTASALKDALDELDKWRKATPATD